MHDEIRIIRRSLLASCAPLMVGLMIVACDPGASAGDEAPMASAAPPVSAVVPADSVPPGADAAAVEQGRELFLPCAVCHGLDGTGNQLGPSLRSGEWIHGAGSLEEIEAIIRSGVPSPREYPVPMVAMGGGDFDDQELRSVASYVFAISRGRTIAE